MSFSRKQEENHTHKKREREEKNIGKNQLYKMSSFYVISLASAVMCAFLLYFPSFNENVKNCLG